MSENAADRVIFRECLGMKFVQKVSDGGHYKEIVIYDYEYYGYVYDITEDYEIYLYGQIAHIFPFDNKDSVCAFEDCLMKAVNNSVPCIEERTRF